MQKKRSQRWWLFGLWLVLAACSGAEIIRMPLEPLPTDSPDPTLNSLAVSNTNLLQNPGSESGTTAWGTYAQGYSIDPAGGRGGSKAIKLVNSGNGLSYGARQEVWFNQTAVKPIFFSGYSRAQNVSGTPDVNYSIYTDIGYTDGTYLFGQTLNFSTGTHDWQYKEATIQPAKPVLWVRYYVLLRPNHTGTVWFDDLNLVQRDSTTTPPPPSPPSITPSGKVGLLVPIYMWPTTKISGTTQTYYQKLVEVKNKYPQLPIIAIVNYVNSDLTSTNSDIRAILDSAVNQLRAANITVLAYVTTDYTQVPLSTVRDQINLWTNRFPGKLHGIFVDEMHWKTENGSLQYYREVYSYIRRTKGLGLSVNNPGGIVEAPYLDGTVADIFNIYEGPSSGIKPTVWPTNPKILSVLTYYDYDWKTSLSKVRGKVSYVYFYDNSPSWQKLATYLDPLAAQLNYENSLVK